MVSMTSLSILLGMYSSFDRIISKVVITMSNCDSLIAPSCLLYNNSNNDNNANNNTNTFSLNHQYKHVM